MVLDMQNILHNIRVEEFLHIFIHWFSVDYRDNIYWNVCKFFAWGCGSIWVGFRFCWFTVFVFDVSWLFCEYCTGVSGVLYLIISSYENSWAELFLEYLWLFFSLVLWCYCLVLFKGVLVFWLVVWVAWLLFLSSNFLFEENVGYSSSREFWIWKCYCYMIRFCFCSSDYF